MSDPLTTNLVTIRKQVAAFNHWYNQHGGMKTDEFLALETALAEIERLQAELDRHSHEPLTVYGADPASEQRGEVAEAGNSAGTSSASVSESRNQSDGPAISKLRNARLDWGMCCNCDCWMCRELDAAILAVVGTAPPPPDVQPFNPLLNFAEWVLGAPEEAERMVEHIKDNARGAIAEWHAQAKGDAL